MRSLTRAIACIALLLLVVLLPMPAAAQATTGSVNGTVTDDTGGVLPGVTVTAASPVLLGNQTAITNERGQFRFPALPPGSYTLTFEMPSFATVVRDRIQVGIGFMAKVDVQLVLASLQETLTVTGASPVVDTQNTAVRNSFTTEMLKSIPNARDIWSLIAEAPGMTVERFDVGGSTAGTQTDYTAYGLEGQNRVNIDGANTTEGQSAAGFYYDYGAFDEISFGASNAADAEMPTPGVLVNTVLKSGGNDLRGDFYFDYENERLQGNNIDADLERIGVGEGTRIKKYMDPNFNLGGPIKRDRIWYFTSFRHQEIATSTTGWPFDAPGTGPAFLTRLQNITYKFTYQANQNNKITHFLQWGRKYQPYRNSGSDASLDAVYKQDSFSWAGKVEWNRVVSPTFFFETRGSTFAYNWPNYGYTPDMQVQGGSAMAFRLNDQITGNNAGGYYPWHRDRRRYQGDVIGHWFRDSWLGGSHSLKFGWLSEWENGEEEYSGYRDSMRLIFRSTSGVDFSTPFRIELFNHPTTYTDALWHHGAFLQDQVRLGQKVTVNAGVRWDYYSAYEPEQVVREAPFRDFFYAGVPLPTSTGAFSLPRTAFADNWIIPSRKELLVYKAAIAPRFGVAWELDDRGRTVVKANWGRFYSNPSVSITDDTNPIQTSYATFGWVDRNADRLFTMDELGPFVSLSGGPRNSVQPDIGHPYTDEVSVFFEQQIVPELGARVGFVHKKSNNEWDLVDIGRPANLWTVPVAVRDPGVDGINGTGDDGPGFTAYSMSNVTVSQSQWQAAEDYDQTYKNIDFTVSKRMSNRWSMVASALHTWRQESWFGSPQNPNEELNNRTDTTLWTFKLFGSYQAPAGVMVSPVLRHQSGDPIPRRIVANTNAGSFTMLVEPSGTYRETHVTIFDVRVEKRFEGGGNRRVSLFLDIFNLNNSNAAQAQDSINGLRTVTIDGQTTQVPRFMYPTVVISPRILRVGARLTF